MVIPTYNRSHFIERAVHSVLNQTYVDFELIVVDDHSTDDTMEKVSAFMGLDSRVRFFCHEANRGAQSARNTGMRASQGDYVAWLDSDDEWLPTKLERQMDVFASDPGQKLAVVYAGHRRVYENGSPSQEIPPNLRGNVYQALLTRYGITAVTLLIRRRILEKIGFCNENIRAFQEWDLCIRLAEHGDFEFVKETLAVYHLHNSLTISKNLKQSALGYMDVVNAHRSNIIQYAGSRVLAEHFMNVGDLFVRAGNFRTAGSCFLQSVIASPGYVRPWKHLLALSLGSTAYRKLRKYFPSSGGG